MDLYSESSGKKKCQIEEKKEDEEGHEVISEGVLDTEE